jgi:hypothetical protein
MQTVRYICNKMQSACITSCFVSNIVPGKDRGTTLSCTDEISKQFSDHYGKALKDAINF